jgi:hypothetical protein
MSDLVKEAIEIYGKAIVSEVSMMVEMSDPDGMYTQFEDMGMYDHAECVEFLYFG